MAIPKAACLGRFFLHLHSSFCILAFAALTTRQPAHSHHRRGSLRMQG